MQVTATLAAVALTTTALVGGIAGAAVHSTATTTVQIECPAPPTTPASSDDMRQFMRRPAPPITGNPRY